MAESSPRRVVVTDANVLINFLNIGRLDLLTDLPDRTMVVPDHVDSEILRENQRAVLCRAYEHARLERRALTDIEAIGVFADLTLVMGQGEAACIALARQMGWVIASDEKGVVRRKVEELLGPGRQVTTPGIIVLAIKAGIIDVVEADRLKADLARFRFRMRFQSFRDVLEHDGP